MKKLLVALIYLVTTITYAQDTLTLYDWEGYTNQELIAKFEQESNIKVSVKTFRSMLEADKIIDSQENFDLIATAHYLLENWINQNKIIPLKQDLLTHYSNLNKDFLIKLNVIDKGNKYAVPYISGISLIAVKDAKAKSSLHKALPNSWGLAFDENYVGKLSTCGVTLIDSPLQVYTAYMLYKGRNLSFTPTNVKSITDDLIKLKPYYKISTNNSITEGFSTNKICVAFSRSSYAQQDDDVILMQLDEGMPMYIDTWVIPSHAKNIESAHKYINFMLRPENAAQIVKATNGITAVNGVKDLVDTKLAQNKWVFPDLQELRKMYLFPSLNNEQKTLLAEEWQRLKKSQ